jgi:murein DD-endopeptidase MepM/ murein hydrolase activator NlpD
MNVPTSADPNILLSSPKTVDGSIVLITVRMPDGSPAGAPKGSFEDIELPFFPLDSGNGSPSKTYQAVLGVPFDHKPGLTTIEVTYAGKTSAIPLTIEDGKYPSEKLQVAKRMVNPRKSDVARIQKEQARIGQIYRQLTEEKLWKGPFSLPIDSPITSIFGTKRLYNGVKKNFHGGLDLRAAVGTPIQAPAGGVVALASDLYFTGKTVILDHGYGVITIYAHMSKFNVKEGERVSAGQLLGLSGKTGRVSGPHLHWQVVVHRQKVNPLDLTRVMQ